MVDGGGAHGLIKTHQLAFLPLTEGDVKSVTRPQCWGLPQAKAGGSVKVCGGELQHLEAPIAKRLETQPGLIAFSWADGAAPVLHGQRRSEFGFHPGGDQLGLVCCISQKLMGHHRARLMHQAGHQQGCVEIEGLQKRTASIRSRTRSAATATL